MGTGTEKDNSQNRRAGNRRGGGGRGREEPGGQRLVLGPALGGGVARRGLGQTVPSPALGWRPGLPNTAGQQLSVPAMSSLPCGRLSRKSCLRQGVPVHCWDPLLASPSPYQSSDHSDAAPPPPRAVPVPPETLCPTGSQEGRGWPGWGVPVGLSMRRGVVCRICPAHQHPGQLDMFSLPKTHILTLRCTHRNTPQEIWLSALLTPRNISRDSHPLL